MMNVGHIQPGRPSMGSWLTYGLGNDNKNLPGFVVLCPEVPTTVGPPLWNSAFLPPIYQGTYISDNVREKKFDPEKLIPNIRNDKFDLKAQKSELDLLNQLDRLQMQQEHADDPQLDATCNPWRRLIACRPKRRMSSTSAKRAKPPSSCTVKEARPAAALLRRG